MLQLESVGQPSLPIPGWRLIARERRPSDREELTAIYRREPKPR
jgi:hypothetical protein